MRRGSLFTAVAVAAFATSAVAQSYDLQNYDLYYVLPGEAGSRGIQAGIEAADVGSIADVTYLNVGGKYSVNSQLEVGALANLGVLIDGGDALNQLTVGVKYGMGEGMALTANLLAVDARTEELGLSLGVMKTINSGDLMINNRLQVGLLDGYVLQRSPTGDGINVDLLVEPTMAFGDKVTGYLDVLVHTNTDDIAGDFLGIDLGPNVDIMVNDAAVVNVGLNVGAAGDAKQADMGMIATFIMQF